MQANVRSQRTLQTAAAVKLQPIPAPRPKSDLSVLHLGKYYPPVRGGMESHLEVLSNELKGVINLRLIVANETRRTVRESADELDLTRVGEMSLNVAAVIGLWLWLRGRVPVTWEPSGL